MGDTSQTITLNAVGGDASASEIAKTSTALNNVTESSGAMGAQFQRPFEHIGLKIFAGDLIRSSGLAGEMRPILTTLMMGMSAVGEAFGAAAGPVMLIVAALAAVTGIVMKVVNSHKELVDSLEKVSETHLKAIETTDTNIASLEKYKAAIGGLPPELQKLLESEEALRQQQIKNQEVTNQGLIVALNERIAKEKDIVDDLNKESTALQATTAHLQGYLKPGMEGYGMLERSATAYNAVQLKVSAADTKLVQDQNQLNKVIADQIGLHNGLTGSLQKQADAAAQDAEKERKDLAEISSAIDAETKRRSSAYKKMQENIDAYAEESQKLDEALLKRRLEAVKSTAGQIGNEFGNAFAQMIVEGKNFTEQMQKAFTRMAESIITDIIRIIFEEEILAAIETYTGTEGAGAALGFTRRAVGGSDLVSKPTLFLAGEAGPEIATFTPVGSGGNSGSGGGGSIGTVNINLNVDHIDGNNPESTLAMLSDQIRRETSAGRQFALTVSGVAGRYPNQAY